MSEQEVFELKNDTVTLDKKLDRVIQFDERSRNFPIMEMVPTKKRRSYTWRCYDALDQGSEGACVGFGVCHELSARPAEVKGLTNEYARQLYYAAQKIDPWPGGAYPGADPVYSGTSVLAGVKIAKQRGYMEGYRWGFGLEDLILGVGYNGPAVLGIAWTYDMYFPNRTGVIKPTGQVVGGHCILCRAVNVKTGYFTLRNSWGPGWGKGGDCYISFADMDKLLNMQGEAVFFLKRHRVARVR